MSDIKYISMPTAEAVHFWQGGTDAFGNAPEIHISDGTGIPCRHCQQDVAKGDAYLVMAYSPFAEIQPYAEVGPIFLHANQCTRYPEVSETPNMFLKRDHYLLKGYSDENRIVYGTVKLSNLPIWTKWPKRYWNGWTLNMSM